MKQKWTIALVAILTFTLILSGCAVLPQSAGTIPDDQRPYAGSTTRAEDGAYGYGLPYFTYYASFSTHVAAWFKLVGFSYAAAIKLAQALALVTGAWAVYGWVSTTRLRVAGGLAAGPFVAALAYTFALKPTEIEVAHEELQVARKAD